MDERMLFDYLLGRLTTADVFPKIYEGFREIDALKTAEDSMLEILKSVAKKGAVDKMITTAGIEKIAEYEQYLELSSGGTIDERRQRVIDFLQRNRVINEDSATELARDVSGNDALYLDVNSDDLTLKVCTPENEESGTEQTEIATAIKALLPYVPQNLSMMGQVQTSLENEVNATCGWTTHLQTELGSIEYVEPEPEPEETFTAYSRSASYQNSNQTLQTAVYTSIYEPGSNNVVSGDTHKDYEITGMWNAAGTELDYDNIGLSCFLVSGNPRIRIYNSSGSTRSWNRIEYKSNDVFKLYTKTDFTDRTFKGSLAGSNSNGITTLQRTPNETYTVIGVYMADGTQIPIPADLTVSYQSSLKQLRIAVQYENTFARVDVVVTGGDEPTTASALSLNNEEEM